MDDHAPATEAPLAAEVPAKPARVPWNKGKLVGAKPPLRPSHVWSIRTKLQIEGKKQLGCQWALSGSMKLLTESGRATLHEVHPVRHNKLIRQNIGCRALPNICADAICFYFNEIRHYAVPVIIFSSAIEIW